MIIIKSVEKLAELRKSLETTLTIGFVPTMGALHSGHIALVKNAVKESDYTVASIFVNPRQFNNKEDLKKYPKSINKDIELLNNAKCDAVFIPEEEDLFSGFKGCDVNLDGLDQILEGKHRPGHFKGVVDVVFRFFDLIRPHKAFFGLKDYQQYLVIKQMTEKFKLKIEIVGCPIIREESGLAMSSRNARLSKSQKESASLINKVLNEVSIDFIQDKTPQKVKDYMAHKLNSDKNLRTEYIEFCEPNTLKPVNSFKDIKEIVICVAVFSGEVRLIDNKYLQL